MYGVLSCLDGLQTKDAHKIRQERIEIARHLLFVDPLSIAAINISRAAHACSWPVGTKGGPDRVGRGL